MLSRNSAQLLQNLGFLSTRAAAVSLRVDPSVSRRGTCDRRICTKPLARRTRGSYGFCMRDSRFVRGRVGLSGLVKDFGGRGGRSGEAVRGGEFGRVIWWFGWRKVRRKTKS